jgi:small-conductance mechanosensitive channel
MNDPRDLEVYQQSTSPVVAFLLFILGVILLVLVVAGLVAAWPTFIAASSLLVKVLVVLTTIAVPAILMGVGVQKGYLALKQMKLADLAVRQAEEELQARQDERRRANERHALDLYLARTRLPADALGNRSFIYDPESHQVIEVSGGNVVQPVPHT